jgi:hypothetical protein
MELGIFHVKSYLYFASAIRDKMLHGDVSARLACYIQGAVDASGQSVIGQQDGLC